MLSVHTRCSPSRSSHGGPRGLRGCVELCRWEHFPPELFRLLFPIAPTSLDLSWPGLNHWLVLPSTLAATSLRPVLAGGKTSIFRWFEREQHRHETESQPPRQLLDTRATELYLKREGVPHPHPRALFRSVGAPGGSHRPAFNLVPEVEGCEFSLANLFPAEGLCPQNRFV